MRKLYLSDIGEEESCQTKDNIAESDLENGYDVNSAKKSKFRKVIIKLDSVEQRKHFLIRKIHFIQVFLKMLKFF